MKYDTAEAFRAALDQRIRNEATTTGLPVMRLRKRVAFERFLARLAIAEPGNWVLKGHSRLSCDSACGHEPYAMCGSCAVSTHSQYGSQSDNSGLILIPLNRFPRAKSRS